VLHGSLFGVPAKPVSDRWTSDAQRNSGSQLWSNSVHLRHRRLCSGRWRFIAHVALKPQICFCGF